jgi:DNA mismatch repair protein MutL
MTISILPARLANQIAAGEVVERPASVIKELVENSLDAGATTINIDVDKGGVKRIRINDNGSGIVKDELTLALSRHATSKIKDLSDLEAINSLGFRGEALASISSVARLTLTSKPDSQDTAWQAIAEGRDMAVTIKPAAHPNGTTIEVLDLFFNTPARRKFLRTEKTEFNHIDEVIRRIALACFNISFSLMHNGKIVRQYRAALTQAQRAKRVAMVCGQKFVDNATEVHCQHDDMLLSGWLAKPSFARNQNDLCYSYVNGRMMRDKLINHAIRQAYADLLPQDTYPAFVLFLSLDHREVDVNVHPAKHEVRFHQSRYVHDFIYSVCHEALMQNNQVLDFHEDPEIALQPTMESVEYARPDYIKPLSSTTHSQAEQQVNERAYKSTASTNNYTPNPAITKSAVKNYQQLITPVVNIDSVKVKEVDSIINTDITTDEQLPNLNEFFITVEQGKYGVFSQNNTLRLLSLSTLALQVHMHKLALNWQSSNTKPEKGLISQPLLLPVVIQLSEQQMKVAQHYQVELALAGILVNFDSKSKTGRVQIRQFPALLREQDVNTSFLRIIEELLLVSPSDDGAEKHILFAIAKVMLVENYSGDQARALWREAKKTLSAQKIESVLLKSIPIDLTSSIKQLLSVTE